MPAVALAAPSLNYRQLKTAYKIGILVKVTDKIEGTELYDLGNNLCYEINGSIQGEISLIKGVTYFFNLSDSSNTEYQIYFSQNNIGNSYSTDALTQGYSLIGTPGTSGSYVMFKVSYDFSSTTYYVAEGGKYMGHKINVIDSIEYSYCSFGPSKDNFGNVKNVNYYK
jgi:hypothetical protein